MVAQIVEDNFVTVKEPPQGVYARFGLAILGPALLYLGKCQIKLGQTASLVHHPDATNCDLEVEIAALDRSDVTAEPTLLPLTD